MSASGNKFTSAEFVNGIYIPSGLLIAGCLIVKQEWLPYAVAVSLVLGGLKVFKSRMLHHLRLFKQPTRRDRRHN